MIVPEKEVADRFWSKVKKFPEHITKCWMWWGAKSSQGYGRFKVNGRLESPHRMVYEWYHGKIPDGYDVCHHCDNPPCVNPDHLFAGTRSDNMIDASEKGNLGRVRGERHPYTTLTRGEVRRIKKMIKRGGGQAAIARLFGVTPSVIYGISAGKTWKHVKID